jgi:hypothetical protein
MSKNWPENLQDMECGEIFDIEDEGEKKSFKIVRIEDNNCLGLHVKDFELVRLCRINQLIPLPLEKHLVKILVKEEAKPSYLVKIRNEFDYEYTAETNCSPLLPVEIRIEENKKWLNEKLVSEINDCFLQLSKLKRTISIS